MHHYITPALQVDLFAGQPTNDPVAVAITEPLPVADGIEIIGIVFGPVRFVVFFADVLAYAGGDPQWVQETADEWAAGFAPAAGARLVKFMRAEADADTMFDPLSWPLPAPGMIWQFCDVLARSLVIHAATYVAVPQYFFMPQSGQLDLLYNRLGKQFAQGRYGPTFRCVTRPAQDKGGFYGFERA
ncbi:hypothetical protein [Cupriavidus basilensis]|uniref:hypothetical protein n=1 Tax=Cupriavidus basilensis TaxID=68895 RepID=UPI0020A6D356|nr:hypothetical protein [Cupriavidus basilensis]MCP3024541.1 hypothetical protein [Cupriavidus basilensis]